MLNGSFGYCSFGFDCPGVVGQNKQVWGNYIDWRIMRMVEAAAELGTDQLREVIKRGYRIVYLVSDEQIEILTVSEGHRQLPQDLLNG